MGCKMFTITVEHTLQVPGGFKLVDLCNVQTCVLYKVIQNLYCKSPIANQCLDHAGDSQETNTGTNSKPSARV